MSIIPVGTKFYGVTSSVDTIDKRSARIASKDEAYTLDEVRGESFDEIGDINFTDLNAASEGVTTIDVVFQDGKPEDKYIDGVFFVNTEAFESYSYGYESNSIDSIALKAVTPADISVLGNCIPTKVAEDITITVTLADANLQDWISGNIKVYAALKDYQTA